MTATQTNLGYVTQIIGPVLELLFHQVICQNIITQFYAKTSDGRIIICEVQQLLGDIKTCRHNVPFMRWARLQQTPSEPTRQIGLCERTG
jgi:hypothetical protein